MPVTSNDDFESGLSYNEWVELGQKLRAADYGKSPHDTRESRAVVDQWSRYGEIVTITTTTCGSCGAEFDWVNHKPARCPMCGTWIDWD